MLGRMPIVFLMLIFTIGFVLLPLPAQADPHAMFYTAIGQRQLFLNMLAALDQADYVEPATDDTPGAPPNASRQDLLAQRSAITLQDDDGNPLLDAEGNPQPIFGPEENLVLNATRTDLAGLLTRSITLEGNDLWSTYQAQQFALEVARRNMTDKLVRVYCARGFGIPGCDPTERAQIDNSGYINNSVKYRSEGPTAALYAVKAGTPEFNEALAAMDSQGKDNTASGPKISIPRYEDVVALHNQDQDWKKSFVNRLANASAKTDSAANPNLFENVEFDNDTKTFEYNKQLDASTQTRTIFNVFSAQNTFIAAAGNANARVVQEHEDQKSESGALASKQVDVLKSENPDGSIEYLSTNTTLTVPAAVNQEAAVVAGVTGAYDSSRDLKQVTANQESTLEGVSAVDRKRVGDKGGKEALAAGPLPAVLGAISGQVAAAKDTDNKGIFAKLAEGTRLFFSQYDKPASAPLSAATALGPIEDEPAHNAALTLATDGLINSGDNTSISSGEKTEPAPSSRSCGMCIGLDLIVSAVVEAKDISCAAFGSYCPL